VEGDLGRGGVGLRHDPHVIDLAAVLEVEQRVEALALDAVVEVDDLSLAILEDDSTKLICAAPPPMSRRSLLPRRSTFMVNSVHPSSRSRDSLSRQTTPLAAGRTGTTTAPNTTGGRKTRGATRKATRGARR